MSGALNQNLTLKVLSRALNLYKQRKFKNAETLLVGILWHFPNLYPAWFWLAKTYAEQERWEDSTEAVYRARRIQPQAVEPLVLMADVFARMGEFHAGEGLLKKAREMSPGNPVVCIACSQFLRKWAGTRDCITSFPFLAQRILEEALHAHSRNLEVWFELGVIFLMQEEGEKAVHAFRQVLEISPDREDALLNLGSAYLAWGKIAKAIEVLKAFVEARPGNDKAMEILSNAREQYRLLN